MTTRKPRHLGQKWYGPVKDDDGETSVKAQLRCKACNWRSDPRLTERQQREQHRAHRREMGEHVEGTLKLEYSERIKALRALHGSEVVRFSGARLCRECGDGWPCRTRRLVDGEAAALDEPTPIEGWSSDRSG